MTLGMPVESREPDHVLLYFEGAAKEAKLAEALALVSGRCVAWSIVPGSDETRGYISARAVTGDCPHAQWRSHSVESCAAVSLKALRRYFSI